MRPYSFDSVSTAPRHQLASGHSVMWLLGMYVYVWLCVCVYTTLVTAQILDRYEGDVCKQEQGVLWTCKSMSACPKAQQDARKGKRPQLCEFNGYQAVICCEPEVAPPPTGTKSAEMCKKYGEYVYRKAEDLVTGEKYNESTCGIVEPLILGGKDAQPREYPHMALIGYEMAGGLPISWRCTGSLISERYVLSAAHCSSLPHKTGPRLAKWVRLGEYRLSTKADNSVGQAMSADYEIAERIVHPVYKATENYHDIALFKLAKDVEGMGEFVRPACLQTSHQFPKTYAIATGWGATSQTVPRSDVLQKVNLTIISKKECVNLFENIARHSPSLKDGINDASMMCAGNPPKDTCQGDSGGPLQVRLKEPFCMYSVIGVTSFGALCGENPGVYTRVSHYISWIESVVWPS